MLRLALHGAGLGWWDWQLARGSLEMNDRCWAMLGMSRSEDIASWSAWCARVHPHDRPELLRQQALVLSHPRRGEIDVEVRMRAGDGAWVWIETKGAVVQRGADDLPTRLMGTHRDISGRKAGEAERDALKRSELAHELSLAYETERRVQTESRNMELAAMLAERTQLLAQREELLAVMAHEVRQPLQNASAALQSASALVVDRSVERETAATSLLRANAVLWRVMAALDNTLTDAVLLGNDARAAQSDVDIDTLVDTAIADIDVFRRTRVSRERLTPARTASMHPGLMRLALRNLINNALAYTASELPVVVRVLDCEEPAEMYFDVCDQGPGIAPALMPRLFERGARHDLEGGQPGHGLGLFIVKRILALHGGSVQLRQPAGGGLTVRLVLPQTALGGFGEANA